MPKTSKWQAQHVKCQAAVDPVKADLADDIERLTAHVEMLAFCLDQARIVLEHFKTELPDPEHRRIAEGGLIASAPPDTLPGESPT